MRKRDAVRLKPGSTVIYYRTKLVDGDPMFGVVARTTDNGGILVYPHSYRHPHVSHNYKDWVSYTQVGQVCRRGKNDFRETVEALNNGTGRSGM